jgi:hypothetical protein
MTCQEAIKHHLDSNYTYLEEINVSRFYEMDFLIVGTLKTSIFNASKSNKNLNNRTV